MRRWTVIAIVVLLAAILITGVAQVILAGRDREYPGPVPGTPLPPATQAP